MGESQRRESGLIDMGCVRRVRTRARVLGQYELSIARGGWHHCLVTAEYFGNSEN